ncbi:conserved unknown protein [Ectocarpus siliculosus]|uniref:Uncharacterized protein n=1 Tax=Ectocarpus siliculosus TaxID=2880 RepID=D7FPM8_ECTSI|nr:conserved unknown protein [Ectocarpus siliculosus]|eukprot:CBJ30485.1 conserved unknown protein [Ectocarpus siliculosus]
MSALSRAAAAAAPPRRLSRASPHAWQRGFASRSLPSLLAPSDDGPLLGPGGRRRPPPFCRTPRAPDRPWPEVRRSVSSASPPPVSSERRGGTTTTTTAAVARAMSSYEWKNMSAQAQKANKEFGELSREEIRKAGEEEVDKVEKALKAMEPFNDVFEVRREGLEVFAELGPEVGTYWIKFDLSIYQICLMSPRSGPHRYIFDKGSGRWIGEADKHDFQGMLTRDIIQSACGIPDF